jgi:hypothetical protein
MLDRQKKSRDEAQPMHGAPWPIKCDLANS